LPGYKTWATNDVITASDMNELHADPLVNDVTTAESVTATTYQDVGSAGPALTKTLVSGQKVLVTVSARLDTPVAVAQEGFVSFAVSGATTLAANDDNAARAVSNNSTAVGNTVERTSVFTATAGGSHTFTMKYKVSGGTFLVRFRRLVIKPF
jgi:hypothetical protein